MAKKKVSHEHLGSIHRTPVKHRPQVQEVSGQRTGVIRSGMYATPARIAAPFKGDNT